MNSLRWRKSAAIGSFLLALSACGGGGGSSASSSIENNAEDAPEAQAVQLDVQIIDVAARSVADGRFSSVEGLPLEGVTLTIESN